MPRTDPLNLDAILARARSAMPPRVYDDTVALVARVRELEAELAAREDRDGTE